MAQKIINTNGLDPAGTGSDDAKTAFEKGNANFTELYEGMARADQLIAFPGIRNLLINGALQINQRVFGGGALAAGAYGFDRWKAGTGGCSVSVASGLITHSSGPLVQVIEAPGLAGQQVTVSVESPTGPVSVSVDGVIGTITAGGGRRGVTLTVPTSSTGNVTLTLTATGVSYSRVQLERGTRATGWDVRAVGLELTLCKRFYEKSYPQDVAPGSLYGASTPNLAYGLLLVCSTGGVRAMGQNRFAVEKRASPTIRYWDQAGNLSTFTQGGVNGDPRGNGFNGDPYRAVFANTTMIGAHCGDVAGYTYFCHWDASAEL